MGKCDKRRKIMKKRIVTFILVCLLCFISVETTIFDAKSVLDLSQKYETFHRKVEPYANELSPSYYYADNGVLSVDIHNYNKVKWEIRLYQKTNTKSMLVDSFYINGEYRTRYHFRDLKDKSLYEIEIHSRTSKASNIKTKVY